VDFIREWITALAGVIVVAAICDIIMIDGEMKKYIKPILGFVMIITVAQPIVNQNIELSWNVPEVATAVSADFSGKIDDLEEKKLNFLYQQKLARQAENELKSLSDDYKNAEVSVMTGDLGEIKKISISLNQSVDRHAVEKIKDNISGNFGIEKNCISVIYDKE